MSMHRSPPSRRVVGSAVPAMPWYSAVRAASAWPRGSSAGFGCGAGHRRGVVREGPDTEAHGHRRLVQQPGLRRRRQGPGASGADVRRRCVRRRDTGTRDRSDQRAHGPDRPPGLQLGRPGAHGTRARGRSFARRSSPWANRCRSRAWTSTRARCGKSCSPPADEDETTATVQVMGGEDWEWWIDALLSADALAPGVQDGRLFLPRQRPDRPHLPRGHAGPRQGRRRPRSRRDPGSSR